jgi:putative membrane-bound dehydrogenase-like protein
MTGYGPTRNRPLIVAARIGENHPPTFGKYRPFALAARLASNALMAAAFLAAASIPGGARAQLPPAAALKGFTVAEGLKVTLIAAEPVIRQPVTMTFDDRGRLWVIQYLQYPKPEGLKPVKVDQFLRTVYDKIPDPPPRGPKGVDKITILYDPDENGVFRKSKDFLSNLNLATGLAIGYGGVFVAQSPYLLFYPDRDGDDVPDGDPEVLLSGFGMEDSHAFLNSLQWGPDGRLYGAQGSTVTANIRGITFQQGIWRYDPITRDFELFSEGGGNTFGLDFDRFGNAIAGTNFGGVGMLHQMQGAYHVKNFGKHGELQNPHAYGYFDHVPHRNFKGGHVTCGGVIYHGGLLGRQYEGAYIAANPLSNAIYRHTLSPNGSTFTAQYAGDFCVSDDKWFRPVDMIVGPDGALYVADWYDKRLNHVDPRDDWDKTSGRIYRIEPAAGVRRPHPAFAAGGLSKLPNAELVNLLYHENNWFAREARRIIAERRDRDAGLTELLAMKLGRHDEGCLPALWAAYSSGRWDAATALYALGHPHEYARAWAVRLAGDAKTVAPGILERMVELARSDRSPVVRAQLACTAKRLPGTQALSIVRELIRRDEDAADPYIPLLTWWAIEDKSITARDGVLSLLDSAQTWRRPIVSRFLVERLARRYMAEGNDAGYAACARLLSEAPGAVEIETVVRGMEKALEGRRLDACPPALTEPIARVASAHGDNRTFIRFGLRIGSPAAIQRAVAIATDAKAARGERLPLIETLGQVGKAEAAAVLLGIVGEKEDGAVRAAALNALTRFSDPKIAEAVLGLYPRMPADLRGRAQTLLTGRPAFARELVKAVEAKQIDFKDVPLEQLRRMMLHGDAALTASVEKVWGKVGRETSGEKLTHIRNFNGIIGRGLKTADLAAGKAIYTKQCGTCHVLFGEGGKIGPELTGVDRKDRSFLLTNIIDPSAVIRNEFAAFAVLTTDGRVLTGLIAESTPKTMTLLNEKNERTVIPREEIEQLKQSPNSLMPEGILEKLTEKELVDLFAYLQSLPAAGK